MTAAAVLTPPMEDALPRPRVLTLDAGVHVLDLTTHRPCTAAVLMRGLAAGGLEDVLLDQMPEPAPSGGERAERGWLLLARVPQHAALLRSTEAVAWRSSTRSRLAAAGVRVPTGARMTYPELAPRTRYHARFCARSRSHPTRASVAASLARMGWRTEHLLCLARDARLDERPDVAVSLWLLVADWTLGRSYATLEEELPFLDVEACGG